VEIFSGASTIGGNVDIRRCSHLDINDVVEIVSTSVGGNFTCHDNAGSCNFGYNSVANDVCISSNDDGVDILAQNKLGGNVMVDHNSGQSALQITGNVIGGNLKCVGNEPPPTQDSQVNTVDGTASGQCEGF
jgi:hypothetical protein